MSGALIELVAKGVQDTFLISEEGQSLFKLKYNRHTNFSQRPMLIKEIDNTVTSIKIERYGDIINQLWLEGTNITDFLPGTVFELYIGGQLIDSHTYDYISDIWNCYLSDTYSKVSGTNNIITNSNKNFFPLHFFFCDNNVSLPLVSIQYHEVEIKIQWGSLSSGITNGKIFGNYIYLDTKERSEFASKVMNILITQVQKNSTIVEDGQNSIDISYFNHPVKSLFFGHKTNEYLLSKDKFTFDSCSLNINGTEFFENLSPTFFHSVQAYFCTNFALNNFNNVENCPNYTRYYMYSFAKNATKYEPSGTINFSRLSNAKLTINNLTRGTHRQSDEMSIYVLNYNILKIERGMAGILFGN